MRKNQTGFFGIISSRLIIVCALAVGLSLAGCATTVPIKSVRAPTIDTSAMERLAVRPFENKSGVGGPLGAQLTQYLTDKAAELITATGRFTIVAPTDPNADGIFTGEVRSIVSKNSEEQREREDDDGNIYYETIYKRDVSLSFIYSVISTRTDMPVGTVNKQGSRNDSDSKRSMVADQLTLMKRIADSELRSLEKDIVPTIVSTNRKLMNETSKDKAVKQLMKTALSLVKNGNYEEAIRQFDEISSEYGSAAARTNAAILRESIASDTAANAQMDQLYNASGLTDTAIAQAIDLLNSQVPPGSNIMVIKTGFRGSEELDFIVDQMTKNIVQEGNIKVVDRSNQHLITAEVELQYSGNVSDDSMVSLGRQLGAQYIALCSISGEMSRRRLTVKVVNVETTQIAAQNDFEI